MSRMLNALRQLESKAETFAPLDKGTSANPGAESPIVEASLSPVDAGAPDWGATLQMSPIDPPVTDGCQPAAELSPLEIIEAAIAQFDDSAALRDVPQVEVREAPRLEANPVLPHAASTAEADYPEVLDEPPPQSSTVLPAVVENRLAQEPLAGQLRDFAKTVAAEFAQAASTTVLIVGVSSGDDSALSAGALAALLAQRDEGEVLLIDANLAHRTLSLEFGLENLPGLAEILTRSWREEDPLLHQAAPNLWVLPAGQDTVLQAPDLNEFIPSLTEELGRGRRWVIVHGGSAESSVTKAFARVCQGAYLTVRLGQSPLEDAVASIEALRRAGANVQGCVVTNVPGTHARRRRG